MGKFDNLPQNVSGARAAELLGVSKAILTREFPTLEKLGLGYRDGRGIRIKREAFSQAPLNEIPRKRGRKKKA